MKWTASLACLLVLAVPGALAAQPKAPTTQAQPAAQPIAGKLLYEKFPKTGTTVLRWNGPMFPPMAKTFEAALAEFKPHTKRFVLVLDSPGGSVREAEHVIALLKDLKKTHRFDTAVDAGKTCASMCPFIYAQGERRMAAPASMWMFHEILYSDRAGKPQYLDRRLWIALVDRYLAPERVAPGWIAHLKQAVLSRDYFASGDSLLRQRTGLITNPIKNFKARDVPQG